MTSLVELDTLRSAIDAFAGALGWANDADFMDSLPEGARAVFRSGVIQCFEVAYDECRKAMLRWIKESDIPVRGNLFRDASALGLIDSVEAWREFRLARNRTRHFYDESFSEDAFAIAADFLTQARQLLAALEVRNGN